MTGSPVTALERRAMPPVVDRSAWRAAVDEPREREKFDLTVYGRQEHREDSPKGWPQRWSAKGGQFTLDGRPIARWPRIGAGHDDDLAS